MVLLPRLQHAQGAPHPSSAELPPPRSAAPLLPERRAPLPRAAVPRPTFRGGARLPRGTRSRADRACAARRRCGRTRPTRSTSSTSTNGPQISLPPPSPRRAPRAHTSLLRPPSSQRVTCLLKMSLLGIHLHIHLHIYSHVGPLQLVHVLAGAPPAALLPEVRRRRQDRVRPAAEARASTPATRRPAPETLPRPAAAAIHAREPRADVGGRVGGRAADGGGWGRTSRTARTTFHTRKARRARSSRSSACASRCASRTPATCVTSRTATRTPTGVASGAPLAAPCAAFRCR